MALSRHLSVRIDDGQTHQVVDHNRVSGLRFTKTAPGGHQACSFRMNLPRVAFANLGPQDRCWIDDTRTARPVFGAAYLEKPTPVDGAAGQAYDLQAFGGPALAADETRPLIYIDQALDSWDKDIFSPSEASVEAGTWAGDEISPRLRLQLPDGQLAATNDFAGADNRVMQRASMKFGAFAFGVQSGKVDAGWKVSLDHPLGSVTLTATITTGGTGFSLFVGDDFPAGTEYVSLRLVRTGLATNVADNQTWTDITNISAVGQRMDRFGTLLVGEGQLLYPNQVLASQVVEDLLGRLLTRCDPTTSDVAATTFGIDQLAYPDGVKAVDILNSLAQYEPDFWWGIHETGVDGRHRFTYQPWATEPRYVISVRDGWQRTGSDLDLCNRIAVFWTDPQGKKQTTYVTADSLGLVGLGLPVDELAAQGRIKDADPITLPDGRGSAANAEQIGAAVLRDKINPPSAGRATVIRPVLDLYTGGYVLPFEIEPGYPVRLRETGETLRLTQLDYDDDSSTAGLTLGTPVLTVDQRLLKLARAAS